MKISESDLSNLEKSIVAADPCGEDLLITDLRNQIFNITDALRKSYGYMRRQVDVTPRFEKPSPREEKDLHKCMCSPNAYTRAGIDGRCLNCGGHSPLY